MRKIIPGCIKMKRSKDGQYYCVILAEGNRRVLHQSETMQTKQSLLNNIASTMNVFGCKPGHVLIIDETC